MGTFAAGAAKALYASRSGRGFAGVALFVVFVGCFCFFFLVAPPLSPAFPVFRPGVPWALASCGHPACPPPCLPFFAPPCLRWLWVPARGASVLGALWSSPPAPLFISFSHLLIPLPFFFACDAPVFCLFPPFFIFFSFFRSCIYLPSCPGCAVLGLVCVSWAVGCAGLCCCGRCAPAGAGVRLRCVVGCTLVVSFLCVLLRVVLRCCGVFCVLPGGVWRACVGPGSCSVLLPPVAVAWSPVVARGCVLSWAAVLRCSGVPPVVSCAAVCVVSCWWFRVLSFALAGAACYCLWLPAVRCWVWLPAVVFRWCVLSRVLLPGRVACCPAECCGLLWCPAPLCCVLCSVVLCCRVVPCCGALLSVFLCWWCWSVSFPCVCGAVLRCASCCSVPVWSALLLAPRAVLCRCVLWCLPWRSVVWWCCSDVSWCLAVPGRVLWCCVALWCRGPGLCCVFFFCCGCSFFL